MLDLSPRLILCLEGSHSDLREYMQRGFTLATSMCGEWRAVSSDSSHHPQEAPQAQSSLYIKLHSIIILPYIVDNTLERSLLKNMQMQLIRSVQACVLTKSVVNLLICSR